MRRVLRAIWRYLFVLPLTIPLLFASLEVQETRAGFWREHGPSVWWVFATLAVMLALAMPLVERLGERSARALRKPPEGVYVVAMTC